VASADAMARSSTIALGLTASRAATAVRRAAEGQGLGEIDRQALESVRTIFQRAAEALRYGGPSASPIAATSNLTSVALTISTAAQEAGELTADQSAGFAEVLDALRAEIDAVVEHQSASSDSHLVVFLDSLASSADRDTSSVGETLLMGHL
jgi:hypothetical protein